jgi:DNA-binding response OmpR family regulator
LLHYPINLKRNVVLHERCFPVMSVNKHILLIEDDPMIGKGLLRALKDIGMRVDWCRDGINGQIAIESGGYDLVLLDLGLPGKSGMDVLRTMRARGDRTTLFIITARDEIDDRVIGLDEGADDYLIKPFGFKELMARILGVLRRNDGNALTTLNGGELTLDMATKEATYRGKTILLSAREFALLHALVEYPGMILSRSQIEERLYGWNEEVESNVVEVLIHAVRKKFDNEIIRNVRGIGWMVIKHCS